MTASVVVVLGLGFGDEGKGSLVDWLVRRGAGPALVVRWNGGPQAAHHVVTDDGRTHCFAQIGSGAFVPGTRTHHGPEMVVDPYALHAEAAALARAGVPDALATLTIDPRAVLVTPWHAIVNRLRELARGEGHHGSTGRGVAEAKLGAERIVAGQLGTRDLPSDVRRLRDALSAVADTLASGASDEARALAARMRDRDLEEVFDEAAADLLPVGVRISATPPAAQLVVLEGAQGALLDRDHGFFPHVTPSRITRRAAEAALAAMGLPGPSEVWGVLRGYHTRHGAGPFPSEEPALSAALPELHNEAGWAGGFRCGWFDTVLASWALGFAGPIDRLALTCLDRIEALTERAIVDRWGTGPRGADLATFAPEARMQLARQARPVIAHLSGPLVAAVEERLGRRVDLESWGPTASGKRARSPMIPAT